MSIATIEVSISALLHNIAFFRRLSPSCKIMAIVKANAYSHGKEDVATLLDNDVDYFGVARLEEGIALRQNDIQSPIVVLEGLFLDDEIELLLDYDLQTVVHCPEQITKLANVIQPSVFNVWFKLDSGMHRLGFSKDKAAEYFMQLANCQSVKKPINIISHFSCADILTSNETLKQIAIFDQFIDSIDDCSLLGKQSLAASGGILAWPSSHRDVIRPGIALYGVSPFGYDELNKATGSQLGLKPVMKLKSEIITVREHKKGESVGYGLIWQSSRDTKLGVVAMGYGDGYPRDIIPATQVWLNDRLVPIVGRVAMDMILIDLGPDSKEHAGTEVIFWGNDELPVEKIAAHSSMSAYELLTRLTERAKLRYVD
ncbi:alanine racemase [Orbus wheelerorum]|uniref:alanine racemase n=1 Tax=Orbus wheelerorum TaxID=3074111 RepID=UPI00370D742B